MDETKGFHVFDTDTKSLEFIPNPYNMFQYITYPNEYSDISGKFIKIIVDEKDSTTSNFITYSDIIKEKNPAKVETKIINKMKLVDDKEIPVYNTAHISLASIAHDYINNLENVNIESLKILFDELYQESEND